MDMTPPVETTHPSLTHSPRARVPLNPPTGLIARFIDWAAARKFGGPADPLRAMLHNPQVLRADLALEAGVSRFKTLHPHLQMLAVMTAASNCGMNLVHYPFCRSLVVLVVVFLVVVVVVMKG